MSDLFRRLLNEKTPAYQLTVAVRPDENDVAVMENVSLGNDAVRVAGTGFCPLHRGCRGPRNYWP
jgi:hypothetical protein